MVVRCTVPGLITTAPRGAIKVKHQTFTRRPFALQVYATMQKSTGTFVNGRKQILRTVEYLPDQEAKPKAILFFHHGYGEHIGRYERGKA